MTMQGSAFWGLQALQSYAMVLRTIPASQRYELETISWEALKDFFWKDKIPNGRGHSSTALLQQRVSWR